MHINLLEKNKIKIKYTHKHFQNNKDIPKKNIKGYSKQRERERAYLTERKGSSEWERLEKSESEREGDSSVPEIYKSGKPAKNFTFILFVGSLVLKLNF